MLIIVLDLKEIPFFKNKIRVCLRESSNECIHMFTRSAFFYKQSTFTLLRDKELYV